MDTLVQPRSLLPHPWRIAALVTVVTNVAFSYASEALAGPGQSVADVSDRYANPFTPAGYAFAIWGLIYGASLAYAVFALLPPQQQVRLHDRVAPWFTLLNAGAVIWLLSFSAGQLVLALVVSAVMLAASAVCYAMATQHLQREGLSVWWRAPFSLWLGWLAVASLANLNVVITAAGWDGMPLSATLWSALLLTSLAVAASIVNIVLGDGLVPLVVAWAATAIAIAHFHESAFLGIVAAVIAIKAALWGASTFLFSIFPMPLRYRAIAARAVRYDPQAPPRFPS